MYEKKDPPVSGILLTLLLRPVLTVFVGDEFPDLLEPRLGFTENEGCVVPHSPITTATRLKANHLTLKQLTVGVLVEVPILEWNKPLFGFTAVIAGDVNQFA